MKTPTLTEIIEMGVAELSELLAGGTSSSLDLFYAQAILHYQRGEVKELESLHSSAASLFPDHPELLFLQTALELRIALRKRELSSIKMEKSAQAFHENSRWAGELAMLLGTACSYLEQHADSIAWFERAGKCLKESGSLRKALKARLNVVVELSHIDPEANLIPRYFDLHQAAMRAQEFSVASTCLLNISREYQIMGGLKAALKYCSEALEIAENNFGSLHFYLILAHRAQLLCELKRFSEAQTDFECALAAPFPEVKAALEVVRPMLSEISTPLKQSGKSEDLLPTWAERVGSPSAFSFSDLENSLLAFLSTGAKDRVQITEHLYGSRLSFDVKVNRFKSLLASLRRKSPHLLVCEEGKYRLSEQIIPPAKRAPKKEGA
jgi:tetratricopeptide (TPR) repeat protein